MSDLLDGWRLNRINIGPPYHVETIKYGEQYKYMRESCPQVCDSRGNVAITHNGAVFCVTREQAEILCERANRGELDKV